MIRHFHSLHAQLTCLLLVTALCGRAQSAPELPDPTFSDVAYGNHPRQKLDLWKADTKTPAPAVIYLHGGAWSNGDKADIRKRNFGKCLQAGISVVSMNYRFIAQARDAGVKPPVEWPMHDAARALQFVRSRAESWNIDPERIAMSGTSAGACTSLWIAFHDDMAVPDSADPVSRQSTRVSCAAVLGAQTSLDPIQVRGWTPNSNYGGHAFGFNGTRDEQFEVFLKKRDEVLPWIREFSPIEHVTKDDPPVYLLYDRPPDFGKSQKDPTHSSNFGIALRTKLDEIGVPCEVTYPKARDIRHAGMEEYLIAALKPEGEFQPREHEILKVALIGDSTMCNYTEDRPDRGWGMFFQDAFETGAIEVSNFAKAGRSTKTFIQQQLWAKTLEWKPRYVFIQFGHNDSHSPDRPESTDPATSYRDFLRRYVEDSRHINASPIFVTPMVRRDFRDDGTLDDVLAPYAEAIKAVAAEMQVPVIDLHASSKKLIESLGPIDSQKFANTRNDRTHFNERGARAMLSLVLRDLPMAEPELAKLLVSPALKSNRAH